MSERTQFYVTVRAITETNDSQPYPFFDFATGRCGTWTECQLPFRYVAKDAWFTDSPEQGLEPYSPLNLDVYFVMVRYRMIGDTPNIDNDEPVAMVERNALFPPDGFESIHFLVPRSITDELLKGLSVNDLRVSFRDGVGQRFDFASKELASRPVTANVIPESELNDHEGYDAESIVVNIDRAFAIKHLWTLIAELSTVNGDVIASEPACFTMGTVEEWTWDEVPKHPLRLAVDASLFFSNAATASRESFYFRAIQDGRFFNWKRQCWVDSDSSATRLSCAKTRRHIGPERLWAWSTTTAPWETFRGASIQFLQEARTVDPADDPVLFERTLDHFTSWQYWGDFREWQAGTNSSTETSRSTEPLPFQYDDPKDLEFDEWIFDTKPSKTWPELIAELALIGPAKGWPPLTSEVRLRDRLKNYCEAKDKPYAESRRGNPVNRKKSEAKKTANPKCKPKPKV